MMYDKRIVQFVGFQTLLDREAFLTRWAPFAMSFLDRGLERIVLAERDAAGDGFAFLSRNEWPEDRFSAAFLGQLPADAGGGGVVAVQVGAFRASSSRDADSGPGQSADKVVALARVVPGALALAVEELRKVAVECGAGARWTLFARDPGTRGGRFDVVLEVHAPTDSAARKVRDVIGSQWTAAPYLEESTVLAMCERHTLP